MSGRMFDKTRARAVVLRSDPRMLIARQLKIVTDLFIGVVIDCSGSMANADNIEKAKLFGTLIAEAAKNYPGIDVRLFGFTDRQIYDCGTANRCAVHNLEAGGGNNDAAGLWHAALAAKASQRKAKLLVMISDGSPTECTVTALRGLVQRLTKRMKICCAQVAVCPLEHICFPHYILLDQANVDLSVRQFGNTMMKLVQQALRG
jgi:cobalamin biosynthesis protein CobT